MHGWYVASLSVSQVEENSKSCRPCKCQLRRPRVISAESERANNTYYPLNAGVWLSPAICVSFYQARRWHNPYYHHYHTRHLLDKWYSIGLQAICCLITKGTVSINVTPVNHVIKKQRNWPHGLGWIAGPITRLRIGIRCVRRHTSLVSLASQS